jgi:hypothetical protein
MGVEQNRPILTPATVRIGTSRRQFLEVMPGRESRTIRSQHYRARRAVGSNRGECVAESSDQRFGQTVACLGTVERQDRNGTIALA